MRIFPGDFFLASACLSWIVIGERASIRSTRSLPTVDTLSNSTDDISRRRHRKSLVGCLLAQTTASKLGSCASRPGLLRSRAQNSCHRTAPTVAYAVDPISLEDRYAADRYRVLTREETNILAACVQRHEEWIRRREAIEEELGRPVHDHEFAGVLGLERGAMQYRGEVEMFGVAREALFNHNIALVFWVAQKYRSSEVLLEDLVQEGCMGLCKAIERFDPTKGNAFSTYAIWWVRGGILRALNEHYRIIRLPASVTHLANKLRKAEREIDTVSDPSDLRDRDAKIADSLGISLSKLAQIREVQGTTNVQLFANWDNDLGIIEEMLAGSGVTPEDYLCAFCVEDQVRSLLKHALSAKEADVIRYTFGIDNKKQLKPRDIARKLDMSVKDVKEIHNTGFRKLKTFVNTAKEHEMESELTEWVMAR